MAEKVKEKETKAVTPWRPFMGMTGDGSDDGRLFWEEDETLVAGAMAKG